MPKNGTNAFPLLVERLPQYCQQLISLPPSEFWIHESKLAELLKLPRGPEHGPNEVLTKILACMKRGFGGNKREKNTVLTGFDAVDLAVSSNKYGIYYQPWGGWKHSKVVTSLMDRSLEDLAGSKLATNAVLK